jgi:uncharacterized protein (DUF1501 family)
MVSRRKFCKTCGILTLTGVMAPSFLAQTVTSAPGGLADGKRALVVVQMTGGNDGINTVVPFPDDAYAKARPTLALKDENLLKLNDSIALNSALKPLKDMYDGGQVAIVQGVGYPNPSYSHFRSMEIWQSAQPETAPRGGWLGRTLEEADKAGDKSAFTRMAMTVGNTGQGGGAPLAFWTEKTVVLSFGGLDRFTFKADPSIKTDRDAQMAAARKIYSVASQNSNAEYVRKTALEALEASNDLSKMASSYKPAVQYPKTQFAERLKTIAQLIDSDYGTRVFYVSTDGSFDTHFNELLNHNRLLQQMSEGLSAFYQDLAAHGHADAVMTMTFSEFGRRVNENGSRGTDHGSAGPMFILGGKNTLKPGLYGTYPSLTDLDAGNMKFSVDFRSVYGTVVKKWLNLEPAPIVGGDFPQLNFLS